MTVKIRKFIPFAKIDEAKREVSGIVTAEVPDKDNEICDYLGTKPYYQAVVDEMSKATDGKSIFPLREMHQLSAVGAGKDIEFRDDAKEIVMTFKVVSDEAWKKCVEGVYTGFSHGGKKVGQSVQDPIHKDCMRYVAAPSEVSLVDNPCLGVAHFALVKADGSVEMRKIRSDNGPAATIPTTPTKFKTNARGNYVFDGQDGGVEMARTKGTSCFRDTKTNKYVVPKSQNEFRRMSKLKRYTVVHVGKSKQVREIEKMIREVIKARLPEVLRKDFGHVARWATIIDELRWLIISLLWEREQEGDESEMPDVVREQVMGLIEAFISYAEEQAEELSTASVAEGGVGPMKTSKALMLLKSSSENLAGHFKKAAAHHTAMAKLHKAMSEQHAAHGEACKAAAEGDGDAAEHAQASAEHAEKMAAHHEGLHKLHKAHADHFNSMCKAAGDQADEADNADDGEGDGEDEQEKAKKAAADKAAKEAADKAAKEEADKVAAKAAHDKAVADLVAKGKTQAEAEAEVAEAEKAAKGAGVDNDLQKMVGDTVKGLVVESIKGLSGSDEMKQLVNEMVKSTLQHELKNSIIPDGVKNAGPALVPRTTPQMFAKAAGGEDIGDSGL